MLAQETGEYIHGEFQAASGSTGGEIVLYGVNGGTRTLGSDERVVVTDAYLVVGAAGEAAIFFDADDDNAADAGERIIGGNFAANSGATMSFSGTPRWGEKGAIPHVVCASGAVTAIITGFITTA